MSKLLSLGRRVRILATTYYGHRTTELHKKYVEKYLVNMKDVEVMSLKKLCRDVNVKYEYITPRETVNRVIRSLSDSSDHVTIILMDEVLPCWSGQPPDWRDLEVRENVIWLLGLSPRAISASSTEVLPPENSFVLTRHLVHKHRNCPQIRNFIKTINTELFI